MNKGIVFGLMVILMASFAITGCAPKQEDVIIDELEDSSKSVKDFKTFNVYTDRSSPGNHYIPSGWMGDFSDIKVNDRYMQNAHSGTTSIQIEYLPRRSQGAGWIGIYWQYPANNWGSKKSGFDLTGAKCLTFWARGDKGGEIISEFKLGGITGEFSDTDSAGIGPAMLTTDWQQFEIDTEGKDLSHIIGGFGLSANGDDNPEGFIIYLDDIRYE